MKLFKYGVYALCASAMLSISSCFNLDEEPYSEIIEEDYVPTEADDHFTLALDVVQIAARCGRSRTGCTAGRRCRSRGGCTAAAGCKAQCQSTGQKCTCNTLQFHIFFLPWGRSASRFPLDLPFYRAKAVNCSYRIARLPLFCKRQISFFAQCTALPRPKARFLWENMQTLLP